MALVDLGLPAGDTSGLPAGDPARRRGRPGDGVTSLLLDRDPHLAVVGVCRAGNDARIALAMRAGARGCVDGDIDGPELARAVIAAGRGQAILSGPVLRELHRGPARR